EPGVSAAGKAAAARGPRGQKESRLLRRLLFAAPGRPTYIDSTHLTRVFTSSGEALTAGWPFAPLTLATSIASASALPLYLAATSLNAGPTFLVSMAWQFRQPLLLASSSCALAAPAAPSAIDATTAIPISFMQPPS